VHCRLSKTSGRRSHGEEPLIEIGIGVEFGGSRVHSSFVSFGLLALERNIALWWTRVTARLRAL
jgi:hypothetical protein